MLEVVDHYKQATSTEERREGVDGWNGWTFRNAEDASDPAVHVALAGTMALAVPVIEELDAAWAATGDEAHARWTRDRVLMGVAGTARGKRLARAWERLAG